MMEVPSWFQHNVSRETLEKLDAYKSLLKKWTAKINLISKSTIDDIAMRHIWDSAQVFQETNGKWVDLGSGGGLPAVVIAILAGDGGKPLDMVLIESDQRKSAFLRTCARELEVPFTVISQRVDQAIPQQASVVSARALSDLNKLLEMAFRHLSANGIGVFMKGAQWKSEIEHAQKNWQFSCKAVPSMTNPDAAILRIKDIQRA